MSVKNEVIVKSIKNDIIAHIDFCIDNKKYNFNLLDFLEHFIVVNYKKTNDAIEKEVASFVYEYYVPLGNELKQVIDLTQSTAKTQDQKDLLDGYSCFKKKEIRELLQFIENIFSDCEKIAKDVSIRKTRTAKRKVKTQDISKTLKNFKYKKYCDNLKIESFDPKNVFKYNMMLAYDTKYNKILLYETNDKSNFVISGTTITNANCIKKSGTTKPKDILEKMMKANFSTVKEIFNALKGKESISSNRMNANIVMLKGFKI